MDFSIKDFFSKCDQICRKLWRVGSNWALPQEKLAFKKAQPY